MCFNIISVVIFMSIFIFDSCLTSDTKDYYKMKTLIENVNQSLEYLIKEQLKDYLKANQISKRSAPEFRNVLIEAQNKLNEKLLKSQRRIKKYKINRRNDVSNDVSNDVNFHSNPIQNTLQFLESVQNLNLVPVFRETGSGYPSITAYNNRVAPNVFYRNVNTNTLSSKLKRHSEDLEDMKNMAEEYDQMIPIKEDKLNYALKSSSNSEKPINYRKLMSDFSHTIKHDGRGYHTSYFIPNIDKIIDDHKQQEFDPKSNNYWKSESDQKIVKNPVKSEIYIEKHNENRRQEPRAVRTVRPITINPNKYSSVMQTNGYNRNTHSYAGDEQPIIRSTSIYRNPNPNEYQSLFMSDPISPIQNTNYNQKQATHPKRTYNQRPEGQFKRQPIFSSEQSARIPDVQPPVHWTRVVSELNEQRNRISKDWRPRDNFRNNPRKLSDDRYYSVDASLRFHQK